MGRRLRTGGAADECVDDGIQFTCNAFAMDEGREIGGEIKGRRAKKRKDAECKDEPR